MSIKSNKRNIFQRGVRAIDLVIVIPIQTRLLNWLFYFISRIKSMSNKNPKKIFFYPDHPDFHYGIKSLLCFMGAKIVRSIEEKPDLVVIFKDITVINDTIPSFPGISQDKILNKNCKNIGKDKVNEVFEKVFGYSLSVDPLTHQGQCVRKSITNALHDGKIIQCPITEPEEGYIYQKLINNHLENDTFFDLRPAIIGNEIPVATKRLKCIDDRFGYSFKETVVEPTEAFQEHEIKKIVEFSNMLGLDYGELDILRDNDDGRIYIVDANNTPYLYVPGRELSCKEHRLMMLKQSDSFRRQFFKD